MNYDFLPQNFVFVSVLGKGGFGTVISAYDKHILRKVAIKILKVSELSQEHIDKLKKEASIFKDLQHPKIVQFYDVFLFS